MAFPQQTNILNSFSSEKGCQPMRTAVFIFACLLSGAFFVNQSLADWPQFRGPNGNGYIGDLKHPAQWSMKKNMAWSRPVPGGGWASPIVIGERVFITTAVDSKNTKPLGHAGGVRNMRGKRPTEPLDFKLICLSLKDGSLQWERSVAREQPKYAIHPSNTYSTESPVTDGKHIFCYFASIGKVAAVGLKGKVVWSIDVGAFPSGNGFGTGSSLTLNDDKLFLQCDNDKDSFVLALDTATGKEQWKQKRSSTTSWSTPFIWKHEKRTDLVICGSGTVTGYDPASGKTNWKLTNTRSAFTASPASDGKYIFLGNSGPFRQGPLLAIGPSINGESKLDSTNMPKGIIWAKPRGGPGMSSPVVSGDYLYICSRGFLTCYNKKTGQEAYKSRLPSAKSIAASMWADEEKIFLMDESGKTFVIKSGPEFKILLENELDDLFWATPAITDGTLLLRGANKLYCIREKQPLKN